MGSPISGSEIIPHMFNPKNLGTKAVIPWVDTDAHGVETPTPGTPFAHLWTGVHEVGGPHPMGARRFSEFFNHDLVNL